MVVCGGPRSLQAGGPLPGDGPCGARLAAALGLGHLSGDRAAWRSCARGRDDVSGKLFLLAPVEEKLRFDMSGGKKGGFIVSSHLQVRYLDRTSHFVPWRARC